MQNSLSNKNSNASWQIAGASGIGKSHLDAGLPNQDSYFYQQMLDVSVAVVCDGAGSASMSEKGSQFFAQAVGDFLLKNALQIANDFTQNFELNIELIKAALATIRQNLANQIPADFSLQDYHSTITAILILPNLNQALSIQIGDSPLLTSQFNVKNQQLDYFENLHVYGEADKTEYVNETHFITQENWQDFLRIEGFDTQNMDCIALMSDGCADLVLTGGAKPYQVYRPFFANLLFNLLQTDYQDTRNALLQTALDNPATYRLTGDDKTLVVLLKPQPSEWQTLEPLIENSLSEDTPASQSVWTNNAENSQQKFMNSEIVPILQAEISTNSAIPQPDLKKIAEKLPEPVTPANSQQTKKLLLAGAGMLLGVLALAGLNRDWLSEQFFAKTAIVPTTATATGAISTTAISTTAIADSEPMTTELPSPITHDINTPLTLHSLDEQPLNVVIGYPDGKMIAPIATLVKVWEDTKMPTQVIFAKTQCQPLLATQQDEFSKFNITVNPTWQYGKCQVTLEAMSQNRHKNGQKTPLPQTIKEIVLPQGLSAIFPVQQPIQTASTTVATVQTLQSYFLPK